MARREIKSPNIFALAVKESVRAGYIPDKNLFIFKENSDGQKAVTKIDLYGLYGSTVRKRVAKSVVKSRVKRAVRNLEHFIDGGSKE